MWSSWPPCCRPPRQPPTSPGQSPGKACPSAARRAGRRTGARAPRRRPSAAAADGAVVEVDDLVEERAAVLDREPRRAQPLRAPQRVRIAEAAVHGPGHGAGIRAEVDHAFMIDLQGTLRIPTGGRSRGPARFDRRARPYSALRDPPRDPLLADGHGRRARARGEPDPGRRPLHRRAAPARAAVPAPHQQLDLHAPRPRRAPAHERARGPRGVDLDLRARDRRLPRRPAPGRLGVRDRRVRADHRAARRRATR